MTERQIHERYVGGRRENSFFIDEKKSSRKLRSRINARVRGIERGSYYIDSNGRLVSEQ